MSKHVNDHMMEVVGPAINDGLAAYFATTVVVVPPPDLIGDSHTLTAGTNAALNRVGYRRGAWGDFQPADIPELNRFFTRTDVNRLVVEIDGDWTAYVFAGIEIERVSTSVIETFGSPNLESYNGTVTRWRWNVPFKFTDGEDFIVKVLQ